jgi:hypothetical protein
MIHPDPYTTCQVFPDPDPTLSISVADPGCLSRIPIRLFSIPDPNCLHPGSRILINVFKYFNPKKGKKMVSKL